MDKIARNIFIAFIILGFVALIIYIVTCVAMKKCDNYKSTCAQPGDDVYDPNKFDKTPAPCCDGQKPQADSKGAMRCPSSECAQPGDDVYDPNKFTKTPAPCCDGQKPQVDSKGAMRCSSSECAQPGDDVYDPKKFTKTPVPCCDGQAPHVDSKGAMRCPDNVSDRWACVGSDCVKTPGGPYSESTCGGNCSGGGGGGKYQLYKHYSNKNSYFNGDWVWDKGHDGNSDYDLGDKYSSDSDTGGIKLWVSPTPSNGLRGAPRMKTLEQYNDGLFIFDVKNIPEGCTVWPALWFLGHTPDYPTPDMECIDSLGNNCDCANYPKFTFGVKKLGWPDFGEIDLIENVNSIDDNSSTNVISAHTSCCYGAYKTTSKTSPKCYTDYNAGCDGCLPNEGGTPLGNQSFGHNFNKNGGGVYALEFTPDYIKTWFIPRSSPVLSTANGPLSNDPDPSTWPVPNGTFTPYDGKPLTNFFRELRIVINTKLCGDYADNDYNWKTCKDKYGKSCSEFVNDYSNTYSKAFWDIQSSRIYKKK